jgi:hypothetical protein
MAGFVRPEVLPECVKLGLAAIMIGGNGYIAPKSWQKMSDAAIDSTVREMVRETGGSTAVLGYLLTDEPSTSAFPAMGKAVAAVKKYAPGRLAYINLYPDCMPLGRADSLLLEAESYPDYLERYIAVVKPQFLSYDNYMVEYSQDLRDSLRTAIYYHNLLDVRDAALRHNLPFWQIVSSNQIRPYTTVPSPANLRFQAYTTLAAGGSGVSWYMYHSFGYGYAPIDSADAKTPTWFYLRDVNREISLVGPVMNRLRSTGAFFTSPAPVDGLPLLPGEIVRSAESETPLMIGEFRGKDGADYVMVVNLSLERSAKFTLLTVKPYQSALIFSVGDGSMRVCDPLNGLWLVAGQGALLRFE